MKVVVDNKEVISQECSGFVSTDPSMSVALLQILQKKVAPINGLLSLSPDRDNYNWNHYYDGTNHYIQWRDK